MGLDATGISLTFGTSAFTAELLSIDQGDASRPDIDDTDHSSSDMEFIPGSLIDHGEFTANIAFDPDAQPPIDQDPETITITFPKKSSGSASGANVAGTGYVKSWSWGNSEVNSKLTATMTVKWDGKTPPAWTDEV